MDWKIELVVVPVADVDRAKAFYVDRAGFTLDVDHSAGEDFRVVQLTPRGSACSIALMKNVDAAGSAQGLQLIVGDTGEPFHFDRDTGAQLPGPDPGRTDYNSFLTFSDPDGNRWMVQEVGRAAGS